MAVFDGAWKRLARVGVFALASLLTWGGPSRSFVSNDVDARTHETGVCAASNADGVLEVEACGPVSVADNTTLFQAAADALCARSPRGGTVRLRATVYTFAPKRSIKASCAIQWAGQHWSEAPLASGTWFHITAKGSTASGGKSLFAQGPGTAGAIFKDIGVSEDMPPVPSAAGQSWSPTVYPPVFSLTGVNGGTFFREIIAAPVYDLISSISSGRTDLSGLYGQVLHSGLFVDLSYDITHAPGAVHFWPYWSWSDYVLSWTDQNGIPITLGRVDGGSFSDVFVLGYASAVRFVLSPNAAGHNLGSAAFASRIWFGHLYADGVRLPVWINGAAQSNLIYYPNNIVIDDLDVSCSGVGAGGAGTKNAAGYAAGASPQPGSSPLLIDSNGAASIDIHSLSAYACSGPIISVNNVQLPSIIRIGTLHGRNIGSYAMYVPSVTAKPPQGGPIEQSDLSIATRPDVDNMVMFGPEGSRAIVDYPKPPLFTQLVTDNMTYQYGRVGGAGPENDPDTMLIDSRSDEKSVHIMLPSSPHDGQSAEVCSVRFTYSDFKLTSALRKVIGSVPSTLLPSSCIKAKFSASVGAWVKYQ